MKIKRGLFLLLVTSVFFSLVLPVFAVPMVINIQGRVTPAPATIPDEIYIKIYDAATGGNLYYGYNDMVYGSDVMSATGVFNINLDLVPTHTSPAMQFLANRDYWVEIGIDGIGTFSPRQKITAVPMAITSRNLVGGQVFTTLMIASAETTPVFSGSTSLDNDIKLPAVLLAGQWLPQGAIAGKAFGGYPGVSGFSNKGWGVFGTTGRTEDENAGGVGGLSAGLSPGIYGANAAPAAVSGYKIGVRGSSMTGYGLAGTGRIGLGAIGTEVGGTFEGRTGVRAIGSVIGLSVTTTGLDGNALRAESGASQQPLVFISNTHGMAGMAIKAYSLGDSGILASGARDKAGMIALAGISSPSSLPIHGQVGLYAEASSAAGTVSTGVYGYTNQNYGRAIYGKVSGAERYGFGVYGEDTTNYLGLDTSEHAAVKGVSTYGTGVRGESTNGYGLTGSGVCGINGIGTSNSADFAGVWGYSGTTGGHGVVADTRNWLKSALVVKGATNGNAIDVRSGKLKIAAGSGTNPGGFVVGTVNLTGWSVAGEADLLYRASVTVNNSYVTTNSLIFLSCESDDYASVSILSKAAGTFTIRGQIVDPRGESGIMARAALSIGTVPVHYLIIN